MNKSSINKLKNKKTGTGARRIMANKNWLEEWLDIEPNGESAIALFWVLNTIGILFPWIIIIIMRIFFPSTGEMLDVNIWTILFFLWPVIAFKISVRKVAPEQTGAVYFAGMPLMTVAPGPYFIFPGILDLDLDLNSNMVYLITAMSDDQIAKEFTQEELQRVELFRFTDVTTGSKEVANMVGNWEGFTPNEEAAVKTDPNHKQAVLRPSIVVTVRKSDYTKYRKNVLGNNPDERKKEIGRQLMLMTKSTVNTEFKKRTYAMLIFLQTGAVLDEQLKTDTENLIEDGDLGLEVISAKVAALGADEAVHKAVNLALAEKFNVDKKELEGEGDKKKAFQTADGDKQKLIKIGEGKAEALRVLLEKAKAAGVDPKRVAELQAEISAFEFGKHTYLTNRQGSGEEKDVLTQIGIMIADAIKEGGKK